MKAQMRFQKILCLVMILVGALALLYAFCYCTGALAELGQSFETVGARRVSIFKASEGKYDAELYNDIQPFNNMLMWFGIIMILAAVLLYITGCQSRRNYYITNYVATGVCAGLDIILSVVAFVLNIVWRSRFLNIDFERWKYEWDHMGTAVTHYSESTAWFDVGFAVYLIVIVAAVLLILNLVWKIKLMKGEKRLLSGEKIEGGAL